MSPRAIGGTLRHLPRLTLIDLLLQQSLSAATILWNELGQDGCPCEEQAEKVVDLVLATLTQMDELQTCLRKRKG